ncbi:hypothetical protein MUN82_10305 [Hymenobacter aerilatus]|uniref:Uncharacterized protein n=1 Tax=Hymenobacter aerilatus TaxID=2932251 RepID=A0A8T9T6M5_9BACT|nr:hypothetical protein [Hymenobacter aerilatus]UOR07469.1 hypothetical protein MUN82_10305 [Hymenobacter aerilatus]
MEQIKNNLPLISAALLPIALLRLIMYYYYFGIDISSYIEFTEALTLSAPAFFLGALFISIMLIIFQLESRTNRNSEILKRLQLKLNAIGYKKRLKKYYLNKEAIVTCFIYPLMFFALYFIIKHFKAPIMLAKISLLFGIYMLLLAHYPKLAYELRLGHLRRKKEVLPQKNRMLIDAIALAVIFIGTVAILEAIYTEYASYPKEATYVTEDETIKSNDDYRFIGKTKNYLFYYNSKTDSYDVYHFDDFNKLTISTGRYYQKTY